MECKSVFTLSRLKLILPRFRWVACQLESLSNLPTDSLRRKALNDLPKGLNETYERILLRIKGPIIPLVVRTLQWLAFAAGRLEISALLEALSIEEESDELDPEARPMEEDVLLYCGSLVRKIGDYIELAHFTVQEYLQSLDTEHEHLKHFRLSNTAPRSLAKTCLIYLCLPAFTSHAFLFEDVMIFRKEYPFYAHASNCWTDYMTDFWADPDPELRRLYHYLFTNDSHFRLFMLHRLIGQRDTEGLVEDRSSHQDVLDIIDDERFEPLHAAAMLGLPEICRHLTINEGIDVDLNCSIGVPLQLCLLTVFNAYSMLGLGLSAVHGHSMVSTMRSLVDAGADFLDVNNKLLDNLFGTLGPETDPMTLINSIEHLIEPKTMSTDSSLSDEAFYPRLMHYIARDQVDHIKELSNDPRFLQGRFGPQHYKEDLLQIASVQHAVQTMYFLLDLGFDPAKQDGEGRNALFYCIGLEHNRASTLR